MAEKILVIGESGSGKTYSMRNLDPGETFYICPDEKDLPFKGGDSKYVTEYDGNSVKWESTNKVETTSPGSIMKILKYISEKRTDIKVVVIDTITQMMTDEFMTRSQEVGYGKFTEMAKNPYDIMKLIRRLRSDLTVIVYAHSETDDKSKETFKRMFVPGGKLLKEKATPEALFTVVLETSVTYDKNEGNRYYFKTMNQGDGIAKSPEGMFDAYLIENDITDVLEKMREFKQND
jgi:hypothetical protein